MSLKSKERTARDALKNIFENKVGTKSPKSGAKTTLATGGKRVNILYGKDPTRSLKRKKKWTKET